MKKFLYIFVTVSLLLALSSCASQTTVVTEGIGPSKVDNTIK